MTDRTSNVVVVTGALGSGKTYFAAGWILQRMLENQAAPFAVFIEPTYKKIDDTAVPTIRDAWSAAGLKEGKHWEHVGSPVQQVRLKVTGQRLLLLSAENPRLIVGAQYCAAVMDEAGDCPELAYTNMRARVRHPASNYRQSLMVGPPQGINWYANRFDSDTIPGWNKTNDRDHWIEKQGKRGKVKYRRIRVETEDNQYLPSDYIDSLYEMYGHNQNLVKSYIKGFFCPLVEGSAYKRFDPSRHIEKTTPSVYHDLYLSWDFNIELCWTAFQVLNFDNFGERKRKYAFERECPKGRTNFDDAIFEFIKRYPPSDGWKSTPIKIDGDRSGHAESHKAPLTDFERIARELRRYYDNVSVVAARSVSPEIGSVEAVNKIFSRDEAVVDPECPELIRSLQATTWVDGEMKIHKPKDDTWTHRGDSIKYPIYRMEFSGLRPEDTQYGVTIA